MAIAIKAVAKWAQLEQVNDMSGKYQIDLTELSDGAVNALSDLGIEVRFKEESGHYITTKSTRPIYAFSAEGENLRGVKIGNGSKLVATIKPYEWKFKGKSGVSPSLDRLVVTELEVYDDADADVEVFDLDEAL